MSDHNILRRNKYCCVFGCFNNNAKNPELSLFKLPVEQERRLQWLRLIDREDLKNKSEPWHVVCETHFRTEDITKNSVRKLLKKNCLPSLNLPNLKKVDKYTQVEIISASGTNEIGTASCQTDVNTTNNLTQTTAGFANSESSGAEQPSCSSFVDSDMEEEHPEEKSDPSPTTWMEIKQEVLWDGEQSAQEPAATQAEQPAGEAAPPRGEERGERQILEELRRKMGTLARRNEVSSGLEEIRQQIKDLAQGDEFDAFGRYVASLLRNMRPRRASHAQPLLINLLAAEMMKQNDDDLA